MPDKHFRKTVFSSFGYNSFAGKSSEFPDAKASLTVEASLVLPIFMFAMFMIISIFHLLIFRTSLQSALFQECRLLSLKRYSSETINDNPGDDVLALIDEKIKRKAPIDGGTDGVDFSESDLSNDEIITISSKYTGKLPFDLAGLFDYSFEQKCTMHAFNGYLHGLDGNNITHNEEEYVYVTEFGTVYHRSLECRHIKLNITQINGDDVANLRNEYGNKYKPCERCHAKKQDGVLFVTSDGDRYHNTKECSGLKRNIKTIPLSEAIGKYAPCSGCGR